MTQFDGRFHPPMTTDETILEKIIGDKTGAYGELDGDVPEPHRPNEVRTLTLEEVHDYYDQHRPSGVTIINRNEHNGPTI